MTRLVILIEFYWTRDKDPRVPLGHASILAALNTVPNIEVMSMTVAVNQHTITAQDIAQSILDRASTCPDTDVAIGAYVWGEAHLRGVLGHLRGAGFKGRIILGGPQISYSGPGLEALYPEADVFVRGYGEDALRRIVQSPHKQAICGIHWAGEFDENRQTKVDLEQLPSPWLTGLIPLEDQRFIRWETQRGCTYRCAFCQHREAGARLTRRALHLNRIKAELDLFCSSDVEAIAILDPIFNDNPSATAILERFIENGYTGHLSLQCRAEKICNKLGTDTAFLDAVEQLDACLEFGLQTIHKRESSAIKRNNYIPGVERAIQQCNRRGIDYEITLIYGLPEQTLESFKQSIDWCLQRGVPVLKAFPLMLLRGTVLDKQRDRWNLSEDGQDMPTVISSNTFNPEDHHQMAKLSQALKHTEGKHPSSVEALQHIADLLVPDNTRFAPG